MGQALAKLRGCVSSDLLRMKLRKGVWGGVFHNWSKEARARALQGSVFQKFCRGGQHTDSTRRNFGETQERTCSVCQALSPLTCFTKWCFAGGIDKRLTLWPDFFQVVVVGITNISWRAATESLGSLALCGRASKALSESQVSLGGHLIL